jgi:hypothetical protein
MESELTTFLTTIDTPAFRQNNLAKVRAKAAAAHAGPDARPLAPVVGTESGELALLTARLQVAVSGK